MPERAAGAGDVALRAGLQSRGDVGVDPADPRTSLHHLGVQAGAATGPRSGDRRTVPDKPFSAVETHAPFLFLDQLLPDARPGLEVWRPRLAGLVAAPRSPGGASLDARTFRELRRPGCHLPAHDLHGHRAGLPGILGRLARDAVGSETPRRPADRGGWYNPR